MTNYVKKLYNVWQICIRWCNADAKHHQQQNDCELADKISFVSKVEETAVTLLSFVPVCYCCAVGPATQSGCLQVASRPGVDADTVWHVSRRPSRRCIPTAAVWCCLPEEDCRGWYFSRKNSFGTSVDKMWLSGFVFIHCFYMQWLCNWQPWSMHY